MHYQGMSLSLFATLLLWRSSRICRSNFSQSGCGRQTGCVTMPYSCQKARRIITYLLCMSRCCQNAATLDSHYLLVVHIKIHMLSKCCHTGQSLPTCCTHQDTHAVKMLPHCHYLLVVHIKINTSHAVKMLPHWTIITYLLCTSRYTKFMLSKCCHIRQSLPTCCAQQDTHAVKRLPHWTVITYLLCTSGYTCCQNAATLDSHYLPVVHMKIRMLSKCCHIRQSLPTCCTH